ncbi:hypothetical protein ACFZCL_37215 [Streptomyces sp. NPDC008159]|uniref:hypothetical protein n=1 Tax=Streptomyces sp. NPDC008159 TaxID=3364817 RepID=UPI0036EE853C
MDSSHGWWSREQSVQGMVQDGEQMFVLLRGVHRPGGRLVVDEVLAPTAGGVRARRGARVAVAPASP